jgi:hypothetical protein
MLDFMFILGFIDIFKIFVTLFETIENEFRDNKFGNILIII